MHSASVCFVIALLALLSVAFSQLGGASRPFLLDSALLNASCCINVGRLYEASFQVYLSRLVTGHGEKLCDHTR